MSDELSDALLVAGTPEECIEGVADLRRRAVAEGYNEFYIGAPLGPDLTEAAELLANIVIPAVWPERAPVVA
jgi:alkanesulfonate monooxygenase SsuD/methylene tetrahydromethanopterin reductase-like flavin-dependent oxidoreductase (luciferase family)